jgi:polysaccharide pyruvyl transferase WcaK-like protein
MNTRVGLLGLYASRNLGDAAIQLAVIDNVSRRLPQVEFLGICPDPEDTRRSFGIDSVDFAGQRGAGEIEDPAPGLMSRIVPWRVRTAARRIAELPGIRRTVASLDLLILSGGGQLDEFWGGAWNHPLQLSVWTRLARLNGVPVAALGLGMDVLETRAARRFCVAAMRAANVRAFRDSGTAAAMESFGLGPPIDVIPDLAFGLPAVPVSRDPGDGVRSPLIAVATISGKALRTQLAAAHERYIPALASACAWWLEQGAHLRFVCSQPAMDLPVVERVVSLLPQTRSDARWQIAETPSVESYMQAVSGADLLVGSRLHGLILALLVECPVIAIAGNRKVVQLMRDVGLAEFTLPLEALGEPPLGAVAARALGEHSALVAGIRSYNVQARNRLAGIFDRVAALVQR